ncbi:hypothetical protein OIO90_005287 [Microbotryomycetes sp. JL221]|nr:hypothetical protein OIO90_005287 [Microbotryomycetes sp. JL221]
MAALAESEHGDPTLGPPKPKRRRLALACDKCRARKIRCDTSQPKCGPCTVGNFECVISGPSASLLRGRPSPQSDPPNGSQVHHSPGSVTGTFVLDDDVAATNGALCLASLTAQAPPPARGPTKVTREGMQNDTNPSSGTITASPMTQTDAHPRINENGLLHLHDDGSRPKFLGSSSSQIYIKWFDQEQPGQRLASHFGHAAESVEEMSSIPGIGVPHVQLPNAVDLRRYVQAYFVKSHPFYPVLDRSTFERYLEARHLEQAVEPVGIDRLLLYLVTLIGADSSTGSRALSSIGGQYLTAAWQSLPLVLAYVDRKSAQCLVLLALACKSRNKDGAAWYLVGYASLGMHLTNGSNLDARIWWTVYVLDKTQSCSGGRPSTIKESDCTVSELALTTNPPFDLPQHAIEALVGMVRLCRIISVIQERLFSAGKADISTVEALMMIGKSDAALAQWVDSLPLQLRPTNEAPVKSSAFVCALQLSVAYHQILILLHRLSLFDDDKLVRPNLTNPKVAPFSTRLLTSASICANSARAILNCFDDLIRSDRAARLFTQDPITLAIFVLAIATYRNPNSWQAKADLALLDSACRMSVADFKASNFRPEFFALLPKLYRIVEARVTGMPTRPQTRAPSPAGSHESVSPQTTIQQAHIQDFTNGGLTFEQDAFADFDNILFNSTSPFNVDNVDGTGSQSVEQLWSSFFGPGVGWSGIMETRHATS